MPLIDAEYEDLLPDPWPEHPAENIRRWARGQQHVLDELDTELLTAIASHQIDHANGIDLNQIGAYFGDLGKRRGRSDSAYRRYLKSLVEAYGGNGTVGAIRFAVAAGILRDEAVVDIEQDYEELEYSVTLTDWADHEIGTLWHLADLSDPSVVDMRELVYDHGSAPVEVAPKDDEDIQVTSDFGTAVIEINPSEMQTDADRDRGLGALELDGDQQLGE